MIFDCLTSGLVPHLIAAADSHGGHAAEPTTPEMGEMFWLLAFSVRLGLYVMCAGLILCLIRLVKGPELADRVLAADLLSLHVVGLVILLTIYIGDLVFFDAAMVVAIIGFVSTVGFAQYIYAMADRGSDGVAVPDIAAAEGEAS